MNACDKQKLTYKSSKTRPFGSVCWVYLLGYLYQCKSIQLAFHMANPNVCSSRKTTQSHPFSYVSTFTFKISPLISSLQPTCRSIKPKFKLYIQRHHIYNSRKGTGNLKLKLPLRKRKYKNRSAGIDPGKLSRPTGKDCGSFLSSLLVKFFRLPVSQTHFMQVEVPCPR